MNSTLLCNSGITLSQQEIDTATQCVTRYLIRFGIRDSGFIRDQSLRIVENRIATIKAAENASTEYDHIGDLNFGECMTSNQSAVDLSSLREQCLQDAAAAMRDLLQQAEQCRNRQAKQFAFVGTDDLLFTTEIFDQNLSSKSVLSEGVNHRIAMVIPTARVRRFNKNATPALVGPLRLGWWKAVLTSWIPRPRRVAAAAVQSKQLTPKLQASPNQNG